MKISTYELSNQQREIQYIRTIPISASLGLFSRGIKQLNLLNFNIKVLAKIGSFALISTVSTSHLLSQTFLKVLVWEEFHERITAVRIDSEA